MADPVAFSGSHRIGDGPQRLSLRPQCHDFPDGLVLGFMRDKLAALAKAEPKRHLPAEIAAARLLVGLHLPDLFADSVALRLREGGGDRQEQLG